MALCARAPGGRRATRAAGWARAEGKPKPPAPGQQAALQLSLISDQRTLELGKASSALHSKEGVMLELPAEGRMDVMGLPVTTSSRITPKS